MHGKSDDPDPGGFFQDLPGGVNPVHVRHGHVHDHHVGVELLDQPDRLAAVFRLGDHLHAGLFFDQRLEPVPDDLVVIGKQNPYGRDLSSLLFLLSCVDRCGGCAPPEGPEAGTVIEAGDAGILASPAWKNGFLHRQARHIDEE